MKYAHVLNNPNNRMGGKEQFVFEMAGADEYIYSAVQVSDNKYIRPVEELDDSDAHIIIFHDIIGIDGNMLESLKSAGKKLVFIAHDYYLICERFTLINNNDRLCGGPYYNNCVYCYIDKFPLLANVGRHTQDLLIKIMRPFNKSLKYYTGRRSRMDDIVSHFDLMVFPTEKARKIMMRFFSNNARTEVINHFQKPLHVTSEKTQNPVFGFVGHDAYHKGLSRLYEAMNILTDSRIRVLIFGDIKERIRDKRIIYKHSFDDAGRYDAFNSFNVLIFPSLWPETWGRVMSEAAISGKYILASNIVPHEEVLRHYSGKRIYTHNSAKSLAKAMSQTVKYWKDIDYPFESASFASIDEYREKISKAMETL